MEQTARQRGRPPIESGGRRFSGTTGRFRVREQRDEFQCDRHDSLGRYRTAKYGRNRSHERHDNAEIGYEFTRGRGGRPLFGRCELQRLFRIVRIQRFRNLRFRQRRFEYRLSLLQPRIGIYVRLPSEIPCGHSGRIDFGDGNTPESRRECRRKRPNQRKFRPKTLRNHEQLSFGSRNRAIIRILRRKNAPERSVFS